MIAMKTNTQETIIFQGKTDHLMIRKDDSFAMKLAMLFEGIISDIPKKELARKYGYTREHYYLLKHLFEKHGSDGLMDKKTGPKKSTKRTDIVNNQIIRLRFLDPDASVEVIGQKMRQMGFSISDRSINRTIQQYGLQKKTSHFKSSKSSSLKPAGSHYKAPDENIESVDDK
jgi:hypothetical protein